MFSRVVGGDRQAVLARQPPVEDRRHGVGRVLVDRRGVAVPGGVARRAGRSSGRAARRRARRRPSASAPGTRRRSPARPGRVARTCAAWTSADAGEDQVRDVRDQQEQRQEHDRRGAEHGQERARRPAGGRRRPRPPRRARARARGRARCRPARSPGARSPPTSTATQTRCSAQRGRLAGQPGQPLRRRAATSGAGERDQQGERDDVAGRRAARGEELGVAPEQVEQRLRDGERPEHGDVQPPLE